MPGLLVFDAFFQLNAPFSLSLVYVNLLSA